LQGIAHCALDPANILVEAVSAGTVAISAGITEILVELYSTSRGQETGIDDVVHVFIGQVKGLGDSIFPNSNVSLGARPTGGPDPPALLSFQ
jgi:hypothetical protein